MVFVISLILGYNEAVSIPPSTGHHPTAIMSFRRLLTKSFVVSSIGFCTSSAIAQEKWTDNTGTRTIEADYVKLEGVQLTLKRADGKELTLPLSKLDDSSRLKARAIARGGKNPAVAVTASETETQSKDSIPVVEFPANATAQEFMAIVIAQLEKNNYVVSWDSLPKSQQNDIQKIVRQISTRLESKTLDDVRGFKANLLRVLKEKKNLLLSSKELAIDPAMKPKVVELWDPLLELLNTMLSDDLLSADKLKTLNARQFLTGLSTDLAPKLQALGPKLDAIMKAAPNQRGPIPDLSDPMKQQMDLLRSLKFQQTTDDEADALGRDPTGKPMRTKYVKVEGKWVEKSSWDAWVASKDQVVSVIEQLDPKEISVNVKRALAAVSFPLGILDAAETQQDVDDILRDTKSTLGSQLPIPGLGPGGMGPGGQMGSPFGGAGYPGDGGNVNSGGEVNSGGAPGR